MIESEAKGISATTHNPGAGSVRRVVRVWVVDDNDELRGLFADLLTHQPGFKCTRQFPSAEALLATLAEERPPDMILLDVNLTGQSGLSALRPIKKLAPSVKVVMMTVFSNSHYEVEAFRDGASGFLLKSYELAEIIKVMQEAYRHPGTPDLFPNLTFHQQATLELAPEQTVTSDAAKPFSLVGTLRQLCGGRRRKTAS